MKRKIAILLATLVALGSIVSARTWTDRDGRKIEAAFVRMAGDAKVVIDKEGKEFAIPLARLSDADRQWLKEKVAIHDKATADKDSPKKSAPDKDKEAVPTTTPLTRAIRIEDFDEALKHITPELVNKMDQGQYHPLTYAAYTGNAGIVKTLLEAGAAPDKVEHNGKTALYVAANLGSPEIITLLHKHGATLPNGDTTLPPGRAAVYSGCPDTLKTLIEKYPHVDLNRGWQEPNDPHAHPEQSGSALNYAAKHAYNEVALILLGHPADLYTTDQLGHNALHYAADDHRCSTGLVKALLAKGMNPIVGGPGEHIIPVTPLELAAARGSLDKVRAMLVRLDVPSEKRRINRAAFIASAHNRTETAGFLFQTINSKFPKPELVAQQFENLRKNQSAPNPKDEHTALKAADLRQLLPNPRPRKLDANLSGSIAIVSPDSLRNLATLLTAEFSAAEGITVLERDAISKIIQENSLKQFQALDSAALHRTFDLIPADHVVILSKKTLDKAVFTQLALINCRSGIISERLAAPQDIDPGEIKHMAARLIGSVQKSKSGGDHVVAISLTPIKPERSNEISLGITQKINTLLPFHANRTPGHIVLEREQIEHLERENAMESESSYWSSGWVIDGGISVREIDQLTITLRATNTVDGKEEQVERTSAIDAANNSLLEAWNSLAARMNPSAKLRHAKHQADEADEAVLLAKHAKWLLDAGYHDDALPIAKACTVLDDKNPELLRFALELSLLTLPISPHKVCTHIYHMPRALEPEIKFPLARHFDDYLSLGDMALRYTRTIKSQLDAPRWVGGVNIRGPFSYDEYVSRALKELLFFRTLMDDTMIERGNPMEIRSLDLLTTQLATLYINKAKDHKSEPRTLLGLFGSDYNYWALHNPELLKRIVDRCLRLGRSLVSPHSRFRKAISNNLPKDVWEYALQSLENSAMASTQLRLYLCRFHAARTREERLEAAMVILELYPLSRHRNFSEATFVHMLGCETFWLSGINTRELSSGFQNPPPGGFEGYLLESAKDIMHTGEFRRMLPLYSWAIALDSIKPEDWQAILSTQLNEGPATRGNQQIRPAGWVPIRTIAFRNKGLPQETRSLLNGFAKNSPRAPANHDSLSHNPEDSGSTPSGNGGSPRLRLGAPAILLPPSDSPRFPIQSALPNKATIVGDELWMPTCYGPLMTRSGIDIPHSSVVHVVALDSGRVRTITAPENSHIVGNGADYDQIDDPSDFQMILTGDTHAYCYAYRNNATAGYGLALFSIDRRTLEVKKVDLPLPHIISAPCNVVDNTLYLSISSSRRQVSENASENMLVSVKDGEVREILVSNRRKPARSPLDTPTNRITKIHSLSGKLVLFSNHQLREYRPKTVKTAILDTATGKWRTLTPGDSDQFADQLHWFNDEHYVNSRSVQTCNEICYFTRQRNSGPFLRLSTNPNWSAKRKPPNDPKIRSHFRDIPVSADIVSDPQFDRPAYDIDPEDLPPGSKESRTAGSQATRPELSWHSANDLIRRNLFDVHIIGKWNGQYVVSLHRKYRAMPGIWLVPEKEMERLVTRVLVDSPPPISFDALPLAAFHKLETIQGTITANEDQAMIATVDRGHLQPTRALQIEGGSDRHILIEASESRKGGFRSISFHAASAMENTKASVTIFAELDGRWKEIRSFRPKGPASWGWRSSSFLKAELPEATRRIRLSCSSRTNDRILIDNIILN